jgi:lysyl-tRNA synthetase class 2
MDSLRLRARVLARVRDYFAQAGVLEVDTPVLSPAGATDPALHSFRTRYHGPGPLHGSSLYLHTSPEFPMKRLLAAGSGSIYQICKVFRDGESGRRHNPEFTLLEWYRVGFDHFDLMDDVELLLRSVLKDLVPLESVVHCTYRELFVECAGVDPFTASGDEIRACLRSHAITPPVGLSPDDHDGWLDLLMTHLIEPRLGAGLVFIRDYPASQAALARLRRGTPPVAARFEAYLNGVELANGYHELTDAAEQERRFAQDNARRVAQGQEPVAVDRRLLAALTAGLPNCAGVALGIDRLLMVVAGSDALDGIITFSLDDA